MSIILLYVTLQEASLSVGQVLTLLLGGGAVATITALFKGLKSMQSGARAREKDTVAELIKQRKEAWRERDQANDERDYWRQRAGSIEFTARQGGITIPEFGPAPEGKPNE